MLERKRFEELRCAVSTNRQRNVTYMGRAEDKQNKIQRVRRGQDVNRFPSRELEDLGKQLRD